MGGLRFVVDNDPESVLAYAQRNNLPSLFAVQRSAGTRFGASEQVSENKVDDHGSHAVAATVQATQANSGVCDIDYSEHRLGVINARPWVAHNELDLASYNFTPPRNASQNFNHLVHYRQ